MKKGKVISQDIKAGEKIDKNSTVSVVVSKGKKPAPKADPVSADTVQDVPQQTAPVYPQQTAPSQGNGDGNSSENGGEDDIDVFDIDWVE